MFRRTEIEHRLQLDSYWLERKEESNQNLGKELLAERNILEDQRQPG